MLQENGSHFDLPSVAEEVDEEEQTSYQQETCEDDVVQVVGEYLHWQDEDHYSSCHKRQEGEDEHTFGQGFRDAAHEREVECPHADAYQQRQQDDVVTVDQQVFVGD